MVGSLCFAPELDLEEDVPSNDLGECAAARWMSQRLPAPEKPLAASGTDPKADSCEPVKNSADGAARATLPGNVICFVFRFV